MKTLITFTVCIIAVIALGIYLAPDRVPTSNRIVSLARNGLPPFKDASISINACQLTIRSDINIVFNRHPFENSKTHISVNLGRYAFENVELTNVTSGQVVITALLRQPDEHLLAQAEKLYALAMRINRKLAGGRYVLQLIDMQVTPDGELPKGEAKGLDREAVREVFGNPNGTLAYRLTSFARTDKAGNILKSEWIEDGLEFLDFAETAIAHDDLEHLAVRLAYFGDDIRDGRLMSGEVKIPLVFRLAAPSRDEAKDLARAFYLYTQKHCP